MTANRHERVVVEADGGARGNPGPAGYGAAVLDADTGETLIERAAYLGVTTNNVAEYSGLIAGLKAAAALGARQVAVRMDSKLVVEQMSGRWQVKHPGLRPLHAEAAKLADGFAEIGYEWIPRARNTHADALANKAMDAGEFGTVELVDVLADPSTSDGSGPARPNDPPADAAPAPGSDNPADAGRSDVDGAGATADAARSDVDGAGATADAGRSDVDGAGATADAGRSDVDGAGATADAARSDVDTATLAEGADDPVDAALRAMVGGPGVAAARPGGSVAASAAPVAGRTRLILVRHAATAQTRRGAFCGAECDPELDEIGRRQAAALADRLAVLAPDAVLVTSPQARARQTAEAIAHRLDTVPRVEPRLVEVSYGAWDGLTFDQVAVGWPAELDAWLAATSVPPPGGESMDSAGARYSEALNEVRRHQHERTIVLVGHGSMVKLMLRDVLDAGRRFLDTIQVDPAGLSVVDLFDDGNAAVPTINDTAHLTA
ncbi:bifunctional RNase H/acid phosphatase [Actinocatenispora sera]|uniref:Bifunctional RNase H/acid phosphatase n=1 Tax=Actinocatenispora sera TaxID=390989 RepID=A0A810L712_9ACTN|nr:bifunctional RNase H/acid phosphatase [Actinocatenispora sera]BCJ31304.1 bifunctional RNase H/acid phosphatase [Actinocatenispora sera]